MILECINNPEIVLVGNDILILEMKKYREKFKSLTASMIYSLIIRKTMVIIPSEENVEKCKNYFPPEKIKDVLHAATALESKSVVITNDKHFNTIRDEKLIEVWSISEAITNLLPSTNIEPS